ncbi:Npun_F0296 family exosortase-dependent surface protein [Sandarakinorhabdus rubra]|uniref:Npun_F0296 family exosortase-dependent surface protein n=1 Tax=Sandarakinorhabdus rubra TaxID=2672568 RepID=UPI001F356D55|nr:PEPxxWA-CTERM sorting domain-containing protein [Sandarakinorhabdus rubra]
MKLLAAFSAATVLAASAQAVTVTGQFGAPDPGPLPGQTIVVDFDNPNATGFSWSGGIASRCNTLQGVAATPAGGSSCFGYVSSAINPNNATLSTPDLESISFYWGSIDRYNRVDVLDSNDNIIFTITGGMLPPADGNQLLPGTNRRINFTAGPNQVIGGLKFSSTGIAFEFDSFAADLVDGTGTGTAVPEPASWAMLIAGFGLVGAAGRRRRITISA